MKVAFFVLLILAALAGPAFASPQQEAFWRIRTVFRSHPVPPYVRYTLIRTQFDPDGEPELEGSYRFRIWFRSSDHAALGRRLFGNEVESLQFMRPAFNEPRDPGPPTADLFEPAPSVPHTIAEPVLAMQTPVPRLIGSVVTMHDLEYRVLSMRTEDSLLHLVVAPRRDPERNRLRELWADKNTYELSKVIATERVYFIGGPMYEGLATINLVMSGGRPLISDVHTRVDFDRETGSGRDWELAFREVSFPAELPEWYFQPGEYGKHFMEAPR
ncbi:MAG: hypothetical protein M3N19_08380 [Candidatus Eremiobacteraeota bacterium]|nr:hypothetical protein [Candidatus Eremiobacteraeota bacterium]